MRAALAIQEAIAEMNDADPTLAFEVRIGVTTGEALVALDERPELGAGIVSGDVVNTGAASSRRPRRAASSSASTRTERPSGRSTTSYTSR